MAFPEDRRFEIAAHAASLGVWDWDLRTNSFFYSTRAKEICGFSPDQDLSFQQVSAVTHPDDLPWTSAQAQRAIDPNIQSREPYRYRIRRADTGEVRWVLAHGEAIFAAEGSSRRAVRYIGTLQDITVQHDAEQALIESEARLRLAVETGRAAVWEIDLDRNALTPSPELNTLFGFPVDARPSIAEFEARYAAGESDRLRQESAELQARGETEIQTPLNIIAVDGVERSLLLRARVAPPTDAIQHRVIGVLIDITSQRRAEQRAELIAGEMQHRVKNLLAIVQSLATQSFKNRHDDASKAFIGRLQALAVATQNMKGDGRRAGALREIIEQAVGPYRSEDNAIVMSGDDAQVSSKTATALALGLHELCTNAVKYGSLSVPGGKIELKWMIERETLKLSWVERGGPLVAPPSQIGFGTQVLTRGLFGESVQLVFEPAGVEGRFSIPLEQA